MAMAKINDNVNESLKNHLLLIELLFKIKEKN